jgi:hypothetical protein
MRPSISRLLSCALVLTTIAAAETGSYAGMRDALRAEITAKLPKIDDAQRKAIVEAKDSKARVAAIKDMPEINMLLESGALDAKLVKHFILHDATPSALAAFAAKGAAQKQWIDDLLADENLLQQIAVADGARPVQAKSKATPDYGRAMEIYTAIQKANPKAKDGVLQRLALATSLEFSESAGTAEDEDAPKGFDPLARYQHFEKAFLDGELDPNFDLLSVWELRFVASATESNETLAWGREMLRTFRPDHITTDDEGGRYANVVGTDVRYGSIDVGKDRPDQSGMQNIFMNGGICGRRAFFARYICRAFGIPATARPSSGHGASARWTPQGWVVVLGPGWRHGSTTTRYRNDLDFLATTQARARDTEFLKVKRAYWIGDVMEEKPCYAEFDAKVTPGFWNGVALAAQRRIIEESKAVTLDAVGAELGEANARPVAQNTAATATSPDDRKITVGADGAITIPAAAHTRKEDKEDDSSHDVITMKSFAGGLQVFLPAFMQQKPILVRGGTYKHEAELCESATRHWRGRRPKNSGHLRGVRLAVTPDEGPVQKEFKLELSDDMHIEFVHIPPGKFIMGGTLEKKAGDILADTPKHEVTLTKGFYLAKYELTREQYGHIMNKEFGDKDKSPDLPMEGIKPSHALRLCEELSGKIGLEVRVPTEAEWEYAARAGTSTRWSFGDDPSQLGEYAWFKDNAGGSPHPVGQKKPNPWGLHDMYGNVAEMVRDDHQEDYYAQGPKVDPVGPLQGVHSTMEFTVEVPKAGTYALSARVATSNVEQSLQLAVNGAESPATLDLPYTLGMWADSEPVTLELKEGKNTLRFWRDRAPQFGVAWKSFTLKPAANR